MRRVKLKNPPLFLLSLIFVLGTPVVWFLTRPPQAPVVWTMVNVNAGDSQGDAHLIEIHQGPSFLLDAGTQGHTQELVRLLKERDTQTLDAWLVSHAHPDHYGGFLDLLQAGIRASKLYFPYPTTGLCEFEHERGWGCVPEHLENFLKAIEAAEIPIHPIQMGQVYYENESTVFKTLYYYDGEKTPIGHFNNINDASAVMLLQTGNTRALLTGDLNQPFGEYLARNGKNLNADILKVPHHGVPNLAPFSFFDQVNPKTALIPTTRTLWQSNEATPIRDYFTNKNIPAHVNGLNGNIEVRMYKDRFRVQSRR